VTDNTDRVVKAREFEDEFGNLWRITPDGPVFVRTGKQLQTEEVADERDSR
jgi:intein/homing endonuclease